MKEIFIPAIFAAALCLAACEKKETPKVSMPPTPATLVEAVGKTVPSYISTLGTTASLQSVNIVPQVSGQIVSINFKQGDMVKAGQILAVVDKRPYEAAVKQAEGNLLQARAQLKIDELQVERNRKLAKDNYVDKQTFDSLLAKVEIDKGIVAASEAALADAKIKLDWCDIKSPSDGKIGLYNIDAGNVVAAGSSVITTVEFVDKLFVDFVIPSQRLYDAMRKMKDDGGKLNITVSYLEDDMSSRKRQAKVQIVLNKIRYETGTAVLRGEIDNSDYMFWPNQPVKVVLDLDEIKDGVLIPDICIQTNNSGPYVYVASAYKSGVYIIKSVPVKKGQLYEGNMRVVEGVKAGDLIADRVSQLRLQAGPFVYRATDKGMILGEDGKPLSTPEAMKNFMVEATKIADELRAEMMKKAAAAAAAAGEKQAAMKAAVKAADQVKQPPEAK